MADDKVKVKCFRCGCIWEVYYNSSWKCPECSEIIRLAEFRAVPTEESEVTK